MAKRRIRLHFCRRCRKMLPPDKFTISPIKPGALRAVCEECRDKPTLSEKRGFLRVFGGERIIILNHIKPGEFKYQVWIDGRSWVTNDSAEFKEILAKHSLVRVKFGGAA